MKYDISKYRPCSDGLKWYAGQKTTEDAWNNCHRGDWMLWIAAKVGVNDRTLTLAKGYCAKTVLHLITDKRSRAAVQAAIDYGSGKIERKKFETYIAAIDATAYAAAYAANINVNVAVAVASATAEDAYANARDACADDLDTTYACAYIAAKAKEKNLKETADICRKYLTKAMRRYF